MGAAAGPNVVEDGLVFALDAGNTKSYPGSGTTWTDLSGNGNNGTLTNGPTFDSGNSGSIVFDGGNDYVSISASINPSGTDLFTYSAWIYIDTIGGNFFSNKAAVLFSGNASGRAEFVLMTDTNTAGPPDRINFSRYGGSTTGSCNLEVDMSVGVWYNITLVRDGASSQKVYQNGVQIGTGNVSNSFTAGTMKIGGAPSQSDYSGHFDGKMSNILYYDRALTAAEVLQNYNALKGRYVSYPIVTSGLILHLDAANTNSYSGSGTTWTDLSDNSNNATLTNGPTFSSDNFGAIVFDGTDDFVTLGTQINSDITTTNVTISFWAYIDSTANDEIFVSMESLTLGQPLIIWYDTSSTYGVQNTGSGDVGGGQTNVITTAVTDASDEKRFTTSSNALSANTWYNIAVVLDVTNNEFYTYINGVEEAKWVSNNTSGGIKSTTNDFRIGGGSPYLDGRISQFLVYTQALTASEVEQNYNALKGRYGY